MYQIPQGYMDYAMQRESGGNVNARNPRSSATGLYQFIDSTWNDLMQKRPDLGLTPDGRNDPEQQKRAMEAFTQQNAASLSKAGHPINNDTLYAAHRFGAGGANKMLGADPATPMNAAFGADVMGANPDLQGKSIQDILGGATATNQAMLPQGATPTAGTMQPQQAPAEEQGYDWAGSLQGAGAALASIGSPAQGAALASLINRKQPKQPSADWDVKINDGQMVRFNKRTGEVRHEQLYGGTPKLSKGQEALDKQAGTEFADYAALGGFADAQKNLASLKETAAILNENPDLTGPIKGSLPEGVQKWMYPEMISARDRVRDVAQRSMRQVLGPQFTQKEGEDIMARAFDPQLSTAENSARVGRLFTALERALAAKNAAYEHFVKNNGSMAGYNGVAQITSADLRAAASLDEEKKPTTQGVGNSGYKVLKVH